MDEKASDRLSADLTFVHSGVIDFGITDFQHPFIGFITMNSLKKSRNYIELLCKNKILYYILHLFAFEFQFDVFFVAFSNVVVVFMHFFQSLFPISNFKSCKSYPYAICKSKHFNENCLISLLYTTTINDSKNSFY